MTLPEQYYQRARNLGLDIDRLLRYEVHDFPARGAWSTPYDGDVLVMVGYIKLGKEFVGYFFNGHSLDLDKAENLRTSHFPGGCNRDCYVISDENA